MKGIVEKGAIRGTIHCKDQFVSHQLLFSKKDGGQRRVIILQDLNTFKAPSVKGNFRTRWLYLQVGPQRRLFLCPTGQTVKEICTFRMGGFPARIPLTFLSGSTVVYKLNKSAGLHRWQVVYKNNSIPRRLSNTWENFRKINLKQWYRDLPITKSRICYKLKEFSSSPNTENRILGNDNRLGRDECPYLRRR